MASENQIAAEILSIFKDKIYNDSIPILEFDDRMVKKDYSELEISKTHWLDTRHCFINRRRNPLNIFTIFAGWSLNDPEHVKQNILKLISQDYTYYKRVSAAAMTHKQTDLENWLYDQSDPNGYGDDVLLFALCREYNRHCIVFSKSGVWTTVNTVGEISVTDLTLMCDVIMVYLGRGLFGIARKKPCNTVRKIPTSYPNVKPCIDRRRKIPAAIDLTVEKDSPSRDECQYATPVPHLPNVGNITDCDSTVNMDSSPVCYVATEAELNATIASAKFAIVPLETELNTYNIVGHIEECTDSNIQSATRGNQIANNCTKGRNLLVHEIVSLQDTVKTYMLSSNYPHQISLDDIERICRLPIMRIQVKTENTVIQQPPPPPVRNCKIVLKPLKEQDLLLWQKPAIIEEELDPNSLPDLHETSVVNMQSPKRYPTRNRHERVKYTTHIATPEDRDSDNWPSPPAKIKKPTSVGPSNARIASRAHGRTRSAETRYILNISNKEKEPPVSTSHDDLGVLSDIDDFDLPNINLEGKHIAPETPQIQVPVTMSSPVPITATYTPSSQTSPVLKTTPSPVSTKKKISKPASELGQPKNTSTKKGSLNIKLHAREKPKSTRKFSCSFCSHEEYSQAAMNAHHIATHNDVSCSKCTKTFRTPSSLSRHMYSHGPKRFMCTHSNCFEGFAFSSELDRHKLTHRTIATHQCQYPGCGKWYFSGGELAKHVRTHDGKRWNCTEIGCTYSTNDKRLLHQHGRKHQPDVHPYECGVCSKSFRYHTQYTRHVRDDDCEKDLF